MKKLFVLFVLALIIGGCAVQQVGITKYTGFTELPFPSNVYTPGQIVEVFSSPNKVEVTFDPQIPWDQATISEGWKISSTETDNIKANLATEISKVLKGEIGYSNDKKIIVDFEDTKTRIVPKNKIFGSLGQNISTDGTLKQQLKSYIKNGTHFDVITQTLSATVTFKIVDNNNSVVSVDADVVNKLNSKLKINLSKQSGTNKLISGTNLVVGIHYDPQMIDILLAGI